MNTEDFVSVAEAAQQKGVTRDAIYKAIEEGSLVADKLFGKTVVSRASLAQYSPRNYPRGKQSVADG